MLACVTVWPGFRPMAIGCRWSLLAAVVFLAVHWSGPAVAQDSLRQWADASGKFKVLATLQRTDDGHAYLQTDDGRLLRIPIARLSQADQDFLVANDNPFEELTEEAMPAASTPGGPPIPGGAAADARSANASANGASANGARANGGRASVSTVWDAPMTIAWDDVAPLKAVGGDSWQLQVATQTPPPLDDRKQRAATGPKISVHEHLRRFVVNPRRHRAVVGHSLTAFVPEPLSRLTLIDLASAKSIATDQVTGDFAPLCLLNDGSTVLMHGSGSGARPANTPDQLEIWHVAGTQIERSATWIPFAETEIRFRKPHNSSVDQAIALANNRVLLRSADGHLTCIDLVSRQPQWFMKLSGTGGAVDALPDQSLVAVIDGTDLMVIDPQQGEIKAARPLGEPTGHKFQRVAWSPDGSRIAATLGDQLWIIDSRDANILQNFTVPEGVRTIGGLAFPHDDYLLISDSLFHLPSQLLACHYTGASLRVAGGACYIAIEGHQGGLVTASTIPHPTAVKMLEEVEKDPDKFLIHPGIKVSLDTSATGPHAAEVAKRLTEAIRAAGYELVPRSEITVVAAILPPVPKQVTYMRSGNRTTQVTESQLKIRWQDRDVWSRSATNEPGSLMLSDGETLEQRLAEIAKHPNLAIYDGTAGLPKLMQRPNPQGGRPGGNALMISQFTVKGLVDLK